ncbi:MAG: hypothetical protein IJT00_05745 [Lachnospiraceae bacterium]|nr:hypothetical protein [Lachnospiraceae bacterium]
MKARKRILATLCMAAMMLSMFTQGLMPMTAYAGSTAITFTKAGGGSESIYAEVTGVTASDILGVSWTGTSSGALTTTDIQ